MNEPYEESVTARSARMKQMLDGAARLERRAHQLILEAAALRRLAERLEKISDDI